MKDNFKGKKDDIKLKEGIIIGYHLLETDLAIKTTQFMLYMRQNINTLK